MLVWQGGGGAGQGGGLECSSGQAGYSYEYCTVWMPWIDLFFAGVRVSSSGYCTVIWWIFPLLFLCTFPIYLM